MAKIGLDIGHGSNTFPPSKGVYKNGKGYAEHSFNAKLGKQLKKELEANGHTIIMGQQPNKPDVPLSTRTNLYNREKVDLVISIHVNYSGSANANGRCAFYWGTSSKSESLAQSIVNEIKALGYSLHGNGLHAGKVGSWTNLHINRVTNMPAVLVEHGFMSGNKDFELVFGSKQDEYIKDMAKADAKGIQKWLGEDYKESKPSKPSKSSKPNKPSSSSKGGSVVDYMNSKKMDSSYNNRKKLAKQYGISNYRGTASQNKKLLSKLKSGKKTSSSSSGGSVVDYMNKHKMNSSYSNRAKLAKKYGIKNYKGTASQNTALLNKLKGGSKPKKSAAQVADEIFRGKGNWGRGSTRKNRLRKAGYNPNQVQKLVNKKFK